MKLSEKIRSQYICPKLIELCVTSIKSPLDLYSSLVTGIKFIWIAAGILFSTVLSTYRNI